ncbi:hypothetical protein L9F63_004636, partial [Diploptera punctata]
MTDLDTSDVTWFFQNRFIYIAKENIVADRLLEKEIGNLNRLSSDNYKVIRLGSLVEVKSKHISKNKVYVRLISKNGMPEDDTWQCSDSVIEPSVRVTLVEQHHIFCELALINVGQKVILLPETQDSRYPPELAVVRYKGPIPKMGHGTYYGLEILVKNSRGLNDGSIFGERYFQCPDKHGIFVALNRLRPYDRSTRNFKTTLVLHLKEKESMSRNNQSSKLEKTEKLIDLDISGENGDSNNVPLKVGDRVVWIADNLAEQGVVRWLGHLDGHSLKNEMMAGVEFDKPIGECSGSYKKTQLFQTKKNHGQFIPLMSLVKAEDFFGVPTECKRKIKSLKLIENCTNSKPNQQNNVMRQPSVSSRKSEGLQKTQRSESYMWSNHLVELSNSAVNNSQSKENLTLKLSDENICRSEYVFSESNHDHSPVNSKVETVNKRSNKDSKNNNIGKKTGFNLSSYPIGEANPRDYFSTENIPGTRREDLVPKTVKSSEGKIRHSYSQDLQSHHSPDDIYSDLWPSVSGNQLKSRIKEDRKTKTGLGPNGKSVKLNNSADPHLEVVGESIQNLLLVPSQDLQDPLLSTSPTGSSGGSSYYELPDVTRDSPEPEQLQDLGVGSVVEVAVNGEPHYGVIRWIGIVPEDTKFRKVAGIEMEEEHIGCTDGTFHRRRYFQCNPKKALFVPLNFCRKDSRFQDVHPSLNDTKVKTFGQHHCHVIPGAVQPISSKGDLESLCGKYRGIQGHHNSCYLDATLFSMFTFT